MTYDVIITYFVYIRQFDDFYCSRGAGQTKLGRILHEGPNVRQSFGGCYKIPYKIFTHFDHVTYDVISPIFMTFTVHEVQAKLNEVEYCMRAQMLDKHLGGVIKYPLKFPLISIT